MGSGRQTIRDLVRASRSSQLIGRAQERSSLNRALEVDGPAVVYVYGPSGIGKTALLSVFERDCAERRVEVVRLEGGLIEPRPEDVAAAISFALGGEGVTIDEIGALLTARQTRTVIIIDDVDSLRLTATWLRRDLAPALPADARLVLAGVQAPPLAWTSDYGPLFLQVAVSSLSREEVLAAALDAGLDFTAAHEVWRLSAGHPLAFQMALQIVAQGRANGIGTTGLASDLARALVAASHDPALEHLVEAAAVVRRATRPLLASMIGYDAGSQIELFAALPFVQQDREGLFIAEPIRKALVERLSAIEPERFADLRESAARWINARLTVAGPSERWRYMADLLFLLDQPVIRDAFFPPDTASPLVEPARPEDFQTILAMTDQMSGSSEQRVVAAWCEALPHRVNVARGTSGEVTAFYTCGRIEDPLDGLRKQDALLDRWIENTVTDPLAGSALFQRHMLERDRGAGGPARAGCYLDIKRAYLERRDLARVYVAADQEALGNPVLRRIGFRPFASSGDGIADTLRLDMPESGLAGWIASLLGIAPQPEKVSAKIELARDSRELFIAGKTIGLTRLEAEVLAALMDSAPAVVTREKLIEQVWQRVFVGSNVVDAVIRTLRVKLGPSRCVVETIPKSGYRYRADLD